MTTRFALDNQNIRDLFNGAFAALNEGIRVIWEGQPGDQGGGPFPALDEEFVRIMIRQNDSRQVAMGNPRFFRHLGSIVIAIQTEANQGTGRNEQIADTVGEAMGAKTVAGLVFRPAKYFQQGVEGDGRWYRGIVQVNYESSFPETHDLS